MRVEALTGEMLVLRSQLDDTASAHQRELHGLQELCADLRSRADVALKEVHDAVQKGQVLVMHKPTYTF